MTFIIQSWGKIQSDRPYTLIRTSTLNIRRLLHRPQLHAMPNS